MPLNKVSADFHNIRIDVGNTEITEGIIGVSWELTVETEKEWGAGREAYDATEGTHNVEDGVLTLRHWAYQNLVEALGGGYMTKRGRFDISVTYNIPDEPTQTDILQRCRIIGVSRDHSQGSDPLDVELTIQIMKVVTNGVDPAAEA